MALFLLLLLLVLLIGGVGAGIQLLWIAAIVGIVAWAISYGLNSGSRGFRRS